MTRAYFVTRPSGINDKVCCFVENLLSFPCTGSFLLLSGQRPPSKNEFSDILGAHGFKPSSEAQKETLKQLKKQVVTKEDDPVKAKVRPN